MKKYTLLFREVYGGYAKPHSDLFCIALRLLCRGFQER